MGERGHTLNGQQVQPGLWDQFRDGVATLAPVRAIGAIYSAAYMGMMMLVLYFQTLVNFSGKTDSARSQGRYGTDYRRPGDGPSGPPRRFGGFHNRRQGGPSAPPMAGGG